MDLDSWDRNDNWTMTVNFRAYPTQYEAIGLKGLFPDWLQPYGVVGVGVIGGTLTVPSTPGTASRGGIARQISRVHRSIWLSRATAAVGTTS